MRPIVEACVDRGSFFEIGKMWGRSVVTGLARLDGWPVAVLASDPFFYGGGWTTDASHKVTRFVDFAETFHLPVVHFVDIPGFVIGVAGEKAATIRHGARALAAVYQARRRGARSCCARSFGVAGAAHQNWQKYNFRYAWPSGDWGSLPLEGGIEAAYKAELAAAARSGGASRGDRGAAQQGALAVPHRRALRRRGDHRPARHPAAPVRVRQSRRADAQARPAQLRIPAVKRSARLILFHLPRHTGEAGRGKATSTSAAFPLLYPPPYDGVEEA